MNKVSHREFTRVKNSFGKKIPIITPPVLVAALLAMTGLILPGG